jgi:hypothetical protein
MTEVMHADGTHILQTAELLLMMMVISGLDLNKSISLWILKHCCH